LDRLILILVLLLVGKGLSRLSAFPGDTFKALANFVIYVSVPALILVQVPKLPISSSVLTPIVMPWVMLVASAVAVLLVSRVFRFRRRTTGALMLLVPLGNTSFLGLPMIEAFLGQDAIPYALLYDQFGTFLAFATYGSFIAAYYSRQQRPAALSLIKRVALFPPFLALLLAFAFRAWPYPHRVEPLLQSVGATLVPIVMVAVGFKLSFRLSWRRSRALVTGLVLKMVVAPLFALAICYLGGLDGPAVRVSVFEAGMPSMITAGALAISEKLDPKLAATMVGYGIVLSFGSLALLARVL